MVAAGCSSLVKSPIKAWCDGISCWILPPIGKCEQLLSLTVRGQIKEWYQRQGRSKLHYGLRVEAKQKTKTTERRAYLAGHILFLQATHMDKKISLDLRMTPVRVQDVQEKIRLSFPEQGRRRNVEGNHREIKTSIWKRGGRTQRLPGARSQVQAPQAPVNQASLGLMHTVHDVQGAVKTLVLAQVAPDLSSMTKGIKQPVK